MQDETLEQGSDAWRAARLGKVTASRIADVLARTKTGWSASRANYLAELVIERLTGVPTEGFVSAAMRDGIEKEPQARAAYEFLRDCTVEAVGFDQHPIIAMAGASPDGLVGADGMVEFKCPIPATHMDTLLGAPIDGRYIKQMQFQMACRPERKWNDWVSFCPQFPAEMQMVIRRVERNDTMISVTENEVCAFLAEVDEAVSKLRLQFALRDAA